MKSCMINDCTGFDTVAPCCLDCPKRIECPDRCPRKEAVFCVSATEEKDDARRKGGVAVPPTRTV